MAEGGRLGIRHHGIGFESVLILVLYAATAAVMAFG
jgi:hypothetical protein